MDKYKFLFLIALLFCGFFTVHGQRLAVKTNSMYLLTSTPNLSVEIGLGRHLSFQLEAGYNAWDFSEKRSLKHYLFTPELRYWFSRPMERHHVALYAQVGKFNLRNIPFLSDPQLAYRGEVFAGGLSYGYQWALGKRWGVEFAVGLGYARIPYDFLSYTDCCAERISSHKRNYFGPTKLALNLIYIIR
jgi:hypothetical protein